MRSPLSRGSRLIDVIMLATMLAYAMRKTTTTTTRLKRPAEREMICTDAHSEAPVSVRTKSGRLGPIWEYCVRLFRAVPFVCLGGF